MSEVFQGRLYNGEKLDTPIGEAIIHSNPYGRFNIYFNNYLPVRWTATGEDKEGKIACVCIGDYIVEGRAYDRDGGRMAGHDTKDLAYVDLKIIPSIDSDDLLDIHEMLEKVETMDDLLEII